MAHKLAIIAVIGLATSAVCMGAAAAIGGPAFGEGFVGMFDERPRCQTVAGATETNRDTVRVTIHDYLYADATGLPGDSYDEEEVEQKADAVYEHVWRAYPTLPSPVYVGLASSSDR